MKCVDCECMQALHMRKVRDGQERMPEVGSSIKTAEGLATSSTAMVRRLRCSTLRPLVPGRPTSALRSGVSSTSSIT